jgi:Protein of unknown function (DUF1593)
MRFASPTPGSGAGQPRLAIRSAWIAALLLLFTAVLASSAQAAASAPTLGGPPRAGDDFRTIVTSDAEIDDMASFHRFLLYTNELGDNLEGIVYSSSRFHWAGDPTANPPIPENNWAGTHVFQDVIAGGGEEFGTGGGYAAVYENLREHDPRFPSPEHLLSLIKIGNITNVGEMAKDTEGSEFIKQALLDDDPRPLWLQVWGGTNTVAAALRSIQEEYEGTPQWEEIQAKINAKARVYIILDQDATYQQYIRPNWPDLPVIVNRDQFWSVAYSSFRATRVPPELESYFQPAFMENIAYGPLLESYPLTSNGTFVSEGDSPAYFHLLETGLRSMDDPTYGGWGGRFAQALPTTWTDWPERIGMVGPRVADDSPYPTVAHDRAYPQTRWIPALQHDFVARAAWQESSYEDANHPPQAFVAPGRRAIEVKAGHKVELQGLGVDPDGDRLTYRWWQYREAGTYDGAVTISGADSRSAGFVVPSDAQRGDTIHLLLEVTDQGDPPLTRYQRVVATVK